MSEGHCKSEDCDAHIYMDETLRELKHMSQRLVESQQALERTSVKLTENLEELQRTNQRIDSYILTQQNKNTEFEKKLAEQAAFMNKAVGVLSTLTFTLPIGLFLLGLWLK